jgi:hypothetical protein
VGDHATVSLINPIAPRRYFVVGLALARSMLVHQPSYRARSINVSSCHFGEWNLHDAKTLRW